MVLLFFLFKLKMAARKKKKIYEVWQLFEEELISFWCFFQEEAIPKMQYQKCQVYQIIK